MPIEQKSLVRPTAAAWVADAVGDAAGDAVRPKGLSACADENRSEVWRPSHARCRLDWEGWEIRLGSPAWSGSLKDLYPGASNDIERIPFAVTNAGQDVQTLDSVRVSIRTSSNGDTETASGVDVPGWRASWFTVSADSHDDALPAEVHRTQPYAGRVDVAMQDGGTDQDACGNASPAVTVSAA